MENHVDGTVVEVQRAAGSVSQTKKKWVAPELRKFQIAEVTALTTSGLVPDGGFPNVS